MYTYIQICCYTHIGIWEQEYMYLHIYIYKRIHTYAHIITSGHLLETSIFTCM